MFATLLPSGMASRTTSPAMSNECPLAMVVVTMRVVVFKGSAKLRLGSYSVRDLGWESTLSEVSIPSTHVNDSFTPINYKILERYREGK